MPADLVPGVVMCNHAAFEPLREALAALGGPPDVYRNVDYVRGSVTALAGALGAMGPLALDAGADS